MNRHQTSIAVNGLMCMVITVLFLASVAMSQQPAAPSQAISKTFQGEILDVKGPTVLAKDNATGGERHLHVDKKSKVQGNIKPGVQVEVKVGEAGYVISIKELKG